MQPILISSCHPTFLRLRIATWSVPAYVNFEYLNVKANGSYIKFLQLFILRSFQPPKPFITFVNSCLIISIVASFRVFPPSYLPCNPCSCTFDYQKACYIIKYINTAFWGLLWYLSLMRDCTISRVNNSPGSLEYL